MTMSHSAYKGLLMKGLTTFGISMRSYRGYTDLNVVMPRRHGDTHADN